MIYKLNGWWFHWNRKERFKRKKGHILLVTFNLVSCIQIGKKGGKKMEKNALDWIALILVIIGGLNWGLVGIFNWNLVDAIFGVGSVVSTIVYILVGVAALYTIYFLFKKE